MCNIFIVKIISIEYVEDRRTFGRTLVIETLLYLYVIQILLCTQDPVIPPISGGHIDLHSPDFDWSLPEPVPGNGAEPSRY